MKTNCVKYVVVAIGLMLVTPVFGATTATLSPAAVTVAPGQKFTVTVGVNPQGVANYTEKLEVIFPKDVLAVDSFAFAPSWIALPQPGYDAVDNAAGVLVKTAGYPAGFTVPTAFGTITFSAKKAGTGAVAIGANSLAFEESRQSAITGGSVAVTVAAPPSAVVPLPPVTAPKVAPAAKPKTPSSAVPAVPKADEKDKVISTTPAVESGTDTVPLVQAAAVAGAEEERGQTGRTWFITAAVILILIGFVSYALFRQDRQ